MKILKIIFFVCFVAMIGLSFVYAYERFGREGIDMAMIVFSIPLMVVYFCLF